jgi:hypothetical protein
MFGQDEVFRHFFGPKSSHDGSNKKSLGSGVIIDGPKFGPNQCDVIEGGRPSVSDLWMAGNSTASLLAPIRF